MKSAENFRDCLPWKLIYFILPEKIKQLPYGFKTRFCDLQPKKFLCNWRPKNLGPWNRLKILEAVKHMKLLFLYFLKNPKNFLTRFSAQGGNSRPGTPRIPQASKKNWPPFFQTTRGKISRDGKQASSRSFSVGHFLGADFFCARIFYNFLSNS